MTIFLPCLLERWRGDGKSLRARPALNTWEDVRRDMIRNLEWLLNTEAPLSLVKDATGKPCAIPEAVANSVLCFGIDPYSGRPQSSMKPEEIRWSIHARILAFETRIDRHTLEVVPLDPADQHRFNKLRFIVRGELRADPLPLEFAVQTEIDTESGRAKVDNCDGGARHTAR